MDEGRGLHIKYRPSTFDELYGNKVMLKVLKSKVEERKTSTYILAGERGTGKTTTARIMAEELGLKSKRDLKEYDIADIGLKDKARQIKEDLRYKPFSGGNRVLILDECQEASAGFWQAMLKTLEEPPHDTYFILCTTDPQKLPKAILSRCSPYLFGKLTVKMIVELLKGVCDKEGADFPNTVLEEIAKKTDGIPRESLVLLDKVIDLDSTDEIDEIILNHFTGESFDKTAFEIARELLNGKKKWDKIAELIKKIENDNWEAARLTILGYMATVLLGGNERAEEIGSLFMENTFYSKKFGFVQACFLANKI